MLVDVLDHIVGDRVEQLGAVAKQTSAEMSEDDLVVELVQVLDDQCHYPLQLLLHQSPVVGGGGGGLLSAQFSQTFEVIEVDKRRLARIIDTIVFDVLVCVVQAIEQIVH